MFWAFFQGLARFALLAQRFVSAIGIATVAAIGLYDFLKSRQARA